MLLLGFHINEYYHHQFCSWYCCIAFHWMFDNLQDLILSLGWLYCKRVVEQRGSQESNSHRRGEVSCKIPVLLDMIELNCDISDETEKRRQ